MDNFEQLDRERIRLNRVIDELQKEGFTYPTQYSYMQEAYDQIIVPPGMKNSGTIKSLSETNNYIERKFGKNFILTKEEYETQLKELLSDLDDVSTVNKFLAEKRADYQAEVNQYLGEIDISNYSTSELRDIMSQAWRAAKEDPDGSASFADHLYDIIMRE